MNIVKVERLSVHFFYEKKWTPILKDISLEIDQSQFTSIIGESGAGKTIFCRAITGLLPQTMWISNGSIFYKGAPVKKYQDLKKLRGSKIFYMPQNPGASLNPGMRIRKQIAEVSKMTDHQLMDLFRHMRINDPERILSAYPFELSGGESQRCLLGMAISSRPELLILDEPVSALDMNIQKMFIALLKELQVEYELSILLITHQLSLVRKVSDYIYIFRSGSIVEAGHPESVFHSPEHPYSKEIVKLSDFT